MELVVSSRVNVGGYQPVIGIENITSSNRKGTQRAKIILDLLSLLLTLGCLAFALYRSLR